MSNSTLLTIVASWSRAGACFFADEFPSTLYSPVLYPTPIVHVPGNILLLEVGGERLTRNDARHCQNRPQAHFTFHGQSCRVDPGFSFYGNSHLGSVISTRAFPRYYHLSADVVCIHNAHPFTTVIITRRGGSLFPRVAFQNISGNSPRCPFSSAFSQFHERLSVLRHALYHLVLPLR